MKYVGNSRPLHDAKTKVMGTQLYAGDEHLTNMCYGALVLSTIPHGYVKSVDASEALAMPGVIKVLTPFNTTQKHFSRYRFTAWLNCPEQETVFTDHVRFVGDRVALVIAESEEIAREASMKVKVEYEALPYALTSQECIEGKNKDMYPEGSVFSAANVEYGDPKAIRQEGLIPVTTHFHLSRQAHATMETHCAIGTYDEGTDMLTIYSPNQSCFGIRSVISDLFDRSYNKTRVVKTTMGGCFGSKQEWMTEPVAAAAALAVKRPVMIRFNRSEEFTSTISRSPMDSEITSYWTKDGKLQGIVMDNTLDAGAYLGNSLDYCGAMSKKLFRVYKYPYAKYTSRACTTNTPVSGAFRGWSCPELYTMLEHNINEAAHKLGMDEIDIRSLNAAPKDTIDLALESSLGNAHVTEELALGRERFRWDEKKAEDKKFNAENVRYKRGTSLACGGHLSGYYPRIADAGECTMRLNEDGSVIALMSLHDHGCGTVEAMRMIIADTLGLDEKLVTVTEADTSSTPWDIGCYSSRTTYVLGKTAYQTSCDLLDQILEAASELTGCKPESIHFRQNGVLTFDQYPQMKMTFGDVAKKSLSTLWRAISVDTKYKNNSNPSTTGTHFAHVEVDTYTGMTRVLDYLAVHDIGHAINREVCVAQVQGAVLMGGGAALYEKYSMRPDGKPTSSFKDYHLINAPEGVNADVVFIEEGSKDGAYGAKSIGEISHVPVAGAIVNAINDAMDADFEQIPINPDLIASYELKKEKQR